MTRKYALPRRKTLRNHRPLELEVTYVLPETDAAMFLRYDGLQAQDGQSFFWKPHMSFSKQYGPDAILFCFYRFFYHH